MRSIGTSGIPSAASAKVLIDKVSSEAPLPPTVEAENGTIIVRWRPRRNQGLQSVITRFTSTNGWRARLRSRNDRIPSRWSAKRSDLLVAISARNGAEEPSPTSSEPAEGRSPSDRLSARMVPSRREPGVCATADVSASRGQPLNANGVEITRYTIER